MTALAAWLDGFTSAAYPCPSFRPDGPLGAARDAGHAAGTAGDQESADLASLEDWAA